MLIAPLIFCIIRSIWRTARKTLRVVITRWIHILVLRPTFLFAHFNLLISHLKDSSVARSLTNLSAVTYVPRVVAAPLYTFFVICSSVQLKIWTTARNTSQCSIWFCSIDFAFVNTFWSIFVWKIAWTRSVALPTIFSLHVWVATVRLAFISSFVLSWFSVVRIGVIATSLYTFAVL